MLSPNSFVNGPTTSFETHNSCPTGWGSATLNGQTVTCAGITSPIGTGPFVYDSRTASSSDSSVDQEVVFTRNTNWWGGLPAIETLTIKHYATAAAVNTALLDGSLDMVIGSGVLAPADLNAFMSNTNFNVVWTGVLMHTLVILNSGRAPTDDINLRKAIIHGVDKASIIQSELNGIGQAVDRVFPRSAPYSSVELTPRWDYDYEKARMLNCPTTSGSDEDVDMGLALGLGIGLGLPLLLAIFAAVVFAMRVKKTEAELQKALTKNVESNSSEGTGPPPTQVGVGAM
jgi:ABC-type transport system substrate-binding protein